MKTTFKENLRSLLPALLGAFLAAAPAAAQKVQINGAGATFPFPIYSKWFDEYHKLHPDIEINYQSIGSGGGIKQLSNETVFFGASDGPMTNEQLASAPGAVLHFPTVLGAVVPSYNIPGVTASLKFTGPVLAEIYLGRITKWNDPAIVKLNPGVSLPATEIAAVHRSDGSGTNYIFCDYLSKVSPEFKKKVGVATSVNWPVGVGGKGNEGVAGLVKQTPGAIGYVELIYALQNKISFGDVQNHDGKFLRASLETTTRCGRRRREGDAPGLPRVDHERARRGRLPDLVLHLDALLREPEGQGAREDHGRLLQVGAHATGRSTAPTSATRRSRRKSSTSR